MNRWSLRRRVTIAFLTASVLAFLALAIGIFAFVNLLRYREHVNDRYHPAVIAQRDLLASLVDQESGVRGFILTGDEDFLGPYIDGVEAEQEHLEFLRTRLEGTAVSLEHLSAIEQQAVQWRTVYAEPEIARVRAFGPGDSVEGDLIEARQQFDAIRAELAELQGEMAEGLEAAKDDLTAATITLVATLSFIAAVVFGLGLFAWIAWSRWTLRPLDRLGYATRFVAAGHLAGPLSADGPDEIVQLGSDVEAMRERIVDEINRLEEAQIELESRARELARSNADLEQFAYVASHDLQEPLRKVTSFCQLLQRRYGNQLDERADQYIEFAVDGARRMQVLINDLLTFSRVGRTTEAFEPVDMQAIAARALADLESIVVENDAKVQVRDLPTVEGDPTLLTMLMRNLLGNALKFRGEQPPMVTISAEATTSPADVDEWTFTVEDNGIGIEPEYAEKVFVIFQRLHAREHFEGTGIGLALAKRIVEFHEGRIWIDTARTIGTAINFTIPRARSAPE